MCTDVSGFTEFANVEDLQVIHISKEYETIERKNMDVTKLKELGWVLAQDGHSLHKTFKFTSFRGAMDWMVSLVPQIDEMDHHPEWRNVYNRVEVTLTTHDQGTITQLDVDLANILDAGFKSIQV